MSDEQKDLGTQERETSVQGKGNQRNDWFQKVVRKVTGRRKVPAKGMSAEESSRYTRWVQENSGNVQTQGREVEPKVDETLKQGQPDAQ